MSRSLIDMAREKRSSSAAATIQQDSQSSSAPTSTKYSFGSIGRMSCQVPLLGNQSKKVEEITSHNRRHVRNEVPGQSTSRNVSPGTDSFVKERSSPPKASPPKRSENAHEKRLQQREAAAASSLLKAKAVSFCNSDTTKLLLTADEDPVFCSSSANTLQEAKLIRPQPIKSAPSGAEVPLAAPVAPFSSSEQSSRLLSTVSLKSPILQTISFRTNSVEQRRTANKKKKALCEDLTEKTRKERELRRAREKTEISRLQKLQCDFPETQESSIAMSGGEYNDPKTPHGGTNDEYAHEQPGHDNLPPQVSNRISLRSPDPRRSGGDEQDQTNPPTPLFERLVTEEVHEIKAYARILESQNRRLTQLERVHGDLEARLKIESQGRQELEATLEAREREWAKQLEHLESDRNHWRHLVQVEETKNNRLMEEVMRKEQEIRRMLQRKYDHDGRTARAMPGRSSTPTEKVEARSPEMGRSDLRSPHDVLKASGSAEKVRLRNMEGLLQDFFGI